MGRTFKEDTMTLAQCPNPDEEPRHVLLVSILLMVRIPDGLSIL